MTPPVLGELLALLPLCGLALLGSELEGVGCSRRADKLALFAGATAAPFVSECVLLGGETERVRLGGVCVMG